MKVVYGHTDSIYVQIDNIDLALETVKEIENVVKKKFPNVLGLAEHPVALEFEKYYSALGVGITKNRNAGMITWEDGVYLNKPKFTMTGFTAKRVSETKLAKEVQTTVLKMWVEQRTQTEINNYLYQTYSSVLNGDVPLKSIIKRSRLREDRFTVKCPECKKHFEMKEIISMKWCDRCGTSTNEFVTLSYKRPSIGSGVAGVLYAWEHQNIKFEDSYLFLRVEGKGKTFTHPLTKEQKQVDYFSGSRYEDFEDWKPDYLHYAEQVIKKAEPIYRAMEWDTSSIRTNRIQRKLEEWW